MDDRLMYTELPVPKHRPGRHHPYSAHILHQPHLHIVPPPAIPSPPITGTHVSRLFPEILAIIFSKLDVPDKGRAAQVCQAWRDAAYDKSVWRGVEAKLHLRRSSPAVFKCLQTRGIRRVQVLSLKKSIRDVIQGVPKLVSLSLRGCYNVTDSALFPFSADLTLLTKLDLSLCKQITDQCFSKIGLLSNLETLDLGGCSNVTNVGLMMIAVGLTKLKWLNLRSCWLISDQGIANIAGLNERNAKGNLVLEYLGLQDCQRLSDEALKNVAAGLNGLKSINLSFCVNITDSGLKHLAKMSSLRDLNLRSCDNISDSGVAYLAESGSRISSLDVSFCDKIGDPALGHISQGLFNLRSLSLSACQITDDGLAKISKTLHELVTLNIGQCEGVTDQGIQAVIESLRHLKSIDLYGCTNITRSGVKTITNHQQLIDINLGLWQRTARR